MSPSSPIPESSIGFSGTWRVRRAAPGTRSSRARYRRPEAIPRHEFPRRPLEHSANLDPKLRTPHVCPSGAPNVARIRWGERIFQKRGSLNLLSRPQNRVSLPNKVVTSARLSRLSNYSWAELMRRVFAFDVLECDRCGGRMRIIAALHPPEAIRKILDCLGLPVRAPPIAPALRGLDGDEQVVF